MKFDNLEIINDEVIYVLFLIKIQWVGYKVDIMMDENKFLMIFGIFQYIRIYKYNYQLV